MNAKRAFDRTTILSVGLQVTGVGKGPSRHGAGYGAVPTHPLLHLQPY